MEVYVKVHTENMGPSWYVHEHDGCGSYLNPGDQLETTDLLGYECIRGTAAKNWKEAKRWAKEARRLANFDGLGKTKVTFWKWHRGKCVKTQCPSSRS